MLKFTPPKVDVRLPRYATWTKGGMKTHTEIGHAKQSLANRASYRREKENLAPDTPYWNRYETVYRECYILELVDGEWYTRFKVEEGTKPEDLPWMKEFYSKYNYGYTSKIPVDSISENYRAYYEDEKNGYKKIKLATPETKEEYALWRIQVELERRGITE